VTSKLFRERAVDLVQDGLYHADAAVENLQSQGVCRSLRGNAEWSVYCMFLFYPGIVFAAEKLTRSQGLGYLYLKIR
jgi:hypothetical protein